ncbi:hypothetical protein OPU71_20440 [Niveibacterium sp. 24ML]|nr:hypothetical protein [Niveibacterium sp. 24ML]
MNDHEGHPDTEWHRLEEAAQILETVTVYTDANHTDGCTLYGGRILLALDPIKRRPRAA